MKEKRLCLSIEEAQLTLLEQVGDSRKCLSAIAVDRQGNFQRPDGSTLIIDGLPLNIYTRRRLNAEQLFPGLGEVPAPRQAVTIEIPDFWAFPLSAEREHFAARLNDSIFSLALVPAARYLAALRDGQLRLTNKKEAYAVHCGQELMGVVRVWERGTAVDLTREIPAFNYGPTMAAFISDNLSRLTNSEAMWARRGLKPLALFAADCLRDRNALSAKAALVIDQLLKGIEQVNSDGWFSWEQREPLVVEATLAIFQALRNPTLKMLLTDKLQATMLRLEALLSSGQKATLRLKINE
jgi:hypothetical protein